MNSNRTVLGGVIIALIGVVVIAGIWYFVLRPPAEASAPIESIPLEIATDTAVPEPTAAPTEPPPTELPPTEPPVAETVVEEPTAEPTLEPTTEPTATPTAEPAGPGLLVYEISQEDSVVRFTLNEVLRGQPTTVIGVTDQVAGQLGVDLQDLATAQVGTIQINARTLATDNNFRNNAIANQILVSEQYEFITFTPTAVNGLPEAIEVGEEITFEIVGDLTIRDVTSAETFAVTATAVTLEQLVGSAATTVLRSDYGLEIPSVPNVADVTDEVLLEIDFVANVLP